MDVEPGLDNRVMCGWATKRRKVSLSDTRNAERMREDPEAGTALCMVSSVSSGELSRWHRP